ncbi:hypothetical protein XMD579_002155 [Marinobacterium sp. xm-d-579]|uniref:hypothetical protein n=1 Tax=Marinobacterium sp. xm-d-579 TaxID=2497734 RepID=UPI00156A4C32|nr:hypothetical protein [Marinobacterium sp. xm-d-579]NRP37314.1 hypothetical protein [Marinobacterium sp. xm-d-579]
MTKHIGIIVKIVIVVCALSTTTGCMTKKYGLSHPLSAEAFKQDIAIGAVVAVGVVAYKKAEELLIEEDL